MYLLPSATPIYFHMVETSSRCFIEEVPADILFQANYKLEHFDKGRHEWVTSDNGLHVEINDPEDKMVLSRTYSQHGRFVFTSHTPGDYRICLSSNSSHWFGGDMLRIHLDIALGNTGQDYQELATHDKLNEIQLKVRQLLDQVEMITKDQTFQRIREEKFRALSVSTNNRVTFWSIAQGLLLVLIGVWQMRNLKSFFQAKKLV
ncbi:Transmembrane emp24 domain-containing protein 4 [Cichlidogyrus casuarinus]|uniref:Transmembrane emp24 domain-containing protein 4 n=1 Tax=Cichlidogyrus casuarinus TaxID=1844966 RepID=A0ABD2PZW7_9PLAT